MSELFKGGVARKDDGKVRMHLVPVTPIQELARVLEFGARKYSPNGWRAGMAWNRVMDSCERHIGAWKQGEDTDPETGLPHLAHALCNLAFLLEYAQTHPELDDRYKQEKLK